LVENEVRDIVAVDLFAGGGGASEGMRRAGGNVVIAVDHDPASILMHTANHPETIHFEKSVFEVSPNVVGRKVDLLWASPDCTHFPRAKGGKPRKKEIRDLAWVVVEWAQAVRPDVICMENVQEFLTWGPLDEEGQPIKKQAGETFQVFVARLRLLGYRVDWRVLCAADYGAPTSRRRLFLVARGDGEPVVWPEPTHGKGRESYRTAAECIDWSLLCPSIFERKKPLAEATQRRIAEGVRRYVLEAAHPFLVRYNSEHPGQRPRVESVDDVFPTVTTENRFGLVIPSLNHHRGKSVGRKIDAPAPTITASFGGHLGLVSAFLAKHYGGPNGYQNRGLAVDEPLGTVTAVDHHGLVAVFLDKLHGSALAGQPIDIPALTVTTGGGRGGGHAALVAVFLTKFYGQGSQAQCVGAPLDTIVSKDRFGLVFVTLDGESYVLADIGMRMLQPRELARAQGFQDSYILTGTKAQQVARIGNSVPPAVVVAVVRAQFGRRTKKGT
jgi:DNA (cytosine-5)-methyltransferase 1